VFWRETSYQAPCSYSSPYLQPQAIRKIPMGPRLLTLLWLPLLVEAHHPASHPIHRAPRDLLRRIAAAPHAAALHPSPQIPPRLGGQNPSPVDFGADPTGRKDSTAALKKCIDVCLNQSSLSPNGVFPGSRSFGNGKNIKDMGGCHVDLAGGEYLISSPLEIPEYNANMILGGGSLVASKDFSPPGGFMVIIGNEDSICKNLPQKSCNIDINFPDLFMDGSHVASTMQINNVMGVTIGPGGYFLNFTSYGVQINGGHEVMIDRCWLGETNFDYDFALEGHLPNATAIEINGNDHYMINTIVFAAKVGLVVNGAANNIQGVHVWFPINRALAFKDNGVMAFHVVKGGNRFNGCYVDGGRAVFEGLGLERNVWTNGFECCSGSGLETIPHGIILAGEQVGPGLHISQCLFNGGSIWHEAAPSKFRRRSWLALATCTKEQFPADLSGVQCDGLTKAERPEADESEEACRQYCCDLQAEGACSMWQWCDPKNKDCGCRVDANAQEVSCGKVKTGGPWTGGALDPPPQPLTGVTDVLIEGNFFDGHPVASRASQALSSEAPITSWKFNFCSQLVFQQITLVRSITVTSTVSGVSAQARPTEDCSLEVVTNIPTSGTLFVEVDSSSYSSMPGLSSGMRPNGPEPSTTRFWSVPDIFA